jgi:hypothetical protein
MGQACPRAYAHHRHSDYRLGGAVPIGCATHHPSRARPCLAGRARRLWSVAPAASAALVERAGPQSGPYQPGLDPFGAAFAGGRAVRSGSAGHHPSGAVGSLAGRSSGGRSHASDWLGRAPISLAQRALPRDDAGTLPAVPAGLSSRGALDMGGRTVASPGRRFLPSCARPTRISVCGCG